MTVSVVWDGRLYSCAPVVEPQPEPDPAPAPVRVY